MSLLRKKDVSVMMDQKSHSKLARHLSGFDLVLLGIGAIIGTGIFVLTGTGALYAGPALPVAFIISAIVCALAALCYAEFSSMIPVSGSVYTYTYATIGELVAWIIGWCLIFGIWFSIERRGNRLVRLFPVVIIRIRCQSSDSVNSSTWCCTRK